MKKNILLFIISTSIIISMSILILFNTQQVAAYQMPEFKDGLVGRWHPGALCISCHYSLGTTEKAQSISSGCKCHDKIYMSKDSKSVYDIESSKIFDLHKKFVCVRCHIGTNKNDASFQDLHNLKIKMECSKCHVVNATIKVPDKKKCFECHGGDPHVVHVNKTEKLCPACHGDFGIRYVENTLLTSEVGMLPTMLIKNETVVIKEYPTIVDFIRNIIKSILNI